MSAVISPARRLQRPLRAWARLSLGRQYALASLPVLIVGMLGLGAWVTRSIEEQVIQNTAVSASLYVNSFVSPELQELSGRSRLTEEETLALDSLIADTPLGQRIKSFKVWLPGGLIAYYTRRQLVGRSFEPTAEQLRAWDGEVSAELSQLGDLEDSAEHLLGIPLLEVYMPVRRRGSDQVIAVAEFYQDARELEARLAQTRQRTWMVVVAVTLSMYGLLFGIVHAGGRLIRRQASELRNKVVELSRLLAQNEALRVRVGRATRRITELNEHFLRRLSADLHDGPAQALGLALLRLDSLAQPASATQRRGERTPQAEDSELEQVRDTLQEALREIRQICRGLSLPELAGLDLPRVLERAARSHRRRTRSEVEVQCTGLDASAGVSMPIKLTAYRVTQEALMNGFRHAAGKGQRVRARREGRWLRLAVSDQGHGFDAGAEEERTDRLGLSGLRERVESLGGRFELHSQPGHGTTVVAVLPLEEAG